jgi:hypothetical protein
MAKEKHHQLLGAFTYNYGRAVPPGRPAPRHQTCVAFSSTQLSNDLLPEAFTTDARQNIEEIDKIRKGDGAECLFEWQLTNSGVERYASNTVSTQFLQGMGYGRLYLFLASLCPL